MDRDYWRSEPTRRLIEEARTKGCELCVALGERLGEADDEMAVRQQDAEDRADVTDREIGRLHERIDELELMLDQREGRIEYLEAQLKGTT